jgi:hypothetical protein
MTQFNKATYNPEDNKLRIYCNIGEERVSDEIYSLLREHDFIYAPIQKLFVAPAWSPKREDLCLNLVGNIIADDVTLVERAEAKAARLDDLSAKRAKEANGYLNAVHRMSQSLSDNQPVLAGHHSQRRALKAHDKIEALQEKWEEKSGAVDYWLYRAQGVERHANSKSSTKTRLNRIKTLLADLRSYQRRISEAHAALSFWTKIESLENSEIKEKKIRYFTGMKDLSPSGLWGKLDKNEITHDEAVTISKNHALNVANSTKNIRYIKHILNRLAYEHSELPWETPLFEGDLTNAILQIFVRTHGGDSPKASKSDIGWLVVTKQPLPIHIGDGKELDLSADDWKALMKSVGYEVPAPAPQKAPICNFKSFGVKVAQMYSNNGQSELLRTIELTKAEYAELNPDSKMVKYSFCGKFRIKVCFDPHFKGQFFSAPKCVVFITDSKVHDVPDSDSVVLESLEVA